MRRQERSTPRRLGLQSPEDLFQRELDTIRSVLDLWSRGPSPTGLLRPFDIVRDLAGETEPFGDLGSLAMNIAEDEEAFTVTADVPGLERKDVHVQLHPDGTLELWGERRTETKRESARMHVQERHFGRFRRAAWRVLPPAGPGTRGFTVTCCGVS